jgi:hypothetical protein
MTKADFLDISKEAVLLSKMLLNAMNTAGAIVIANWAGSEKKEFKRIKNKLPLCMAHLLKIQV